MKLWHSAVLISAMLGASLSPLYATEVEVKLPAGYAAAQLLSPGTGPVLQHYRSQLDSQLKRLDDQYQLKAKQAAYQRSTQDLAASRSRLDQRLASLRQDCIARIHVKIVSASLTDLGSSSAMGDINFYYSVTNNTGRIIGALIYHPTVGQLKIPTASSLYLDLIDFTSMRFGLPSGATLSNQGVHPEQFSFFAENLSQSQIAMLKRDVNAGLNLQIEDVKFLRQTGYKGQTQELSFEEAYAGEIRPYRDATNRAEAALKSNQQLADEARANLNAAKQSHEALFASEAKTLLNSAQRYRAKTTTFTAVKPGTYYLFASGQRGQALFEKVTIKADRHQTIKAGRGGANPFIP